jgi:hypothetical protein
MFPGRLRLIDRGREGLLFCKKEAKNFYLFESRVAATRVLNSKSFCFFFQKEGLSFFLLLDEGPELSVPGFFRSPRATWGLRAGSLARLRRQVVCCRLPGC